MKMLAKLAAGSLSLIAGLKITAQNFFSTLFGDGLATEQYPKQKPTMSDAFRGPIKFVLFEELNSHDCIACQACAKICPSACIIVKGGKVDGIKRKRPSFYEMDFASCSLCGLCIDVCPTDTLEWGKAYEDAGYSANWTHHLMEPFAEKEENYRKAQAQREAKAAAEKKQKAAARKKAQADKKKTTRVKTKKATQEDQKTVVETTKDKIEIREENEQSTKHTEETS